MPSCVLLYRFTIMKKFNVRLILWKDSLPFFLVNVYFIKVSLQKLLIDDFHSDSSSVVFLNIIFTVFVAESGSRLASTLSLASLKAMNVKRLFPIIQYFLPKFILGEVREAHYQHI